MLFSSSRRFSSWICRILFIFRDYDGGRCDNSEKVSSTRLKRKFLELANIPCAGLACFKRGHDFYE